MKLRARGITLVELLVALAVVALLAAMAWPGYGAMLQRAHRAEARLALMRIQQLQEVHYATHLRYASRIGENRDEETLAATERTDNGRYRLALEGSDQGQGYLATASVVADGSQSRDRHCYQLAVDESGLRRSADASGAWSDSDPYRCWG